MMPDLSTSQIFALQFSLSVQAGLLAIAWCAARHRTPDGAARIGAWLDAGLGTLVGGTLIARGAHVLLEWDYFRHFPEDILRVWYGGLNWHGAILGGLLGAALVCIWRKAPYLAFTDALALALPFGLMGGWWACRRAGCGYGLPVDSGSNVAGWLTGYLPDMAGDVTLRLEVQIGGVMSGMLVLALVAVLTAKDWLPGLRLWPALFLTGLFMFLFGFLRGDPSDMALGRRLDQNLDVALMILSAATGFGTWFYLQGRAQSPPQPTQPAPVP
jgi:phosphatidylglycerol:prolipoprotein diacylglycerol transferase